MDLGLDRLDTALEKFVKLPKAYRLAMLPGIVVLVAGLYYFLLYGGTRQELVRLEGRQKQLQRKLNEARSVAANMARFEAELVRLEEELEAALEQLPNRKELPMLLVDVTTLGKNAGLEVTAFRPKPEERKDFYARVPIQLEFSGRYHDIAHFFDKVSKLPRIVNVGDLEMSVRAAKADETVLNVSGTATTFRFIEQ